MFYGYEKTFQSLGKLGQDIIKTTNRIKVKQNDLLYHLVFPSKNQIWSKIKRDIRYLFHQSFDIEQGGTYFWMTLILQSSMSCKYNSADNGMMESFFSI